MKQKSIFDYDDSYDKLESVLPLLQYKLTGKYKIRVKCKEVSQIIELQKYKHLDIDIDATDQLKLEALYYNNVDVIADTRDEMAREIYIRAHKEDIQLSDKIVSYIIRNVVMEDWDYLFSKLPKFKPITEAIIQQYIYIPQGTSPSTCLYLTLLSNRDSTKLINKCFSEYKTPAINSIFKSELMKIINRKVEYMKKGVGKEYLSNINISELVYIVKRISELPPSIPYLCILLELIEIRKVNENEEDNHVPYSFTGSYRSSKKNKFK